jgi:hypothetical protein
VDGQRLAPAALQPGKKSGTHSTGGLVGPSFGMDECGVEKSTRSLTGVRIAKSVTLWRVGKRLRYPDPSDGSYKHVI